MAQLVNNPPAMWETWIRSLGWDDPLKKGKATHSSVLAWRIPWTIQSKGLQRVRHDWATFNFTLGFPDSSAGKESTCKAGDPGSIPGSRRSAGEGIGHPLQYSWASLVTQLVKNPPAMQETWVWSLGWEDPLEKGKASHSSILAWRIPWPVQSMGSQRAGHDWATFTQIPPVSGITFAFICLTYFTITSRSICVVENGIILFYGCRMFLPHLLCPFICQWTFCCEQCCSEPCEHVPFQSGFPWIGTQERNCRIIWQVCF